MLEWRSFEVYPRSGCRHVTRSLDALARFAGLTPPTLCGWRDDWMANATARFLLHPPCVGWRNDWMAKRDRTLPPPPTQGGWRDDWMANRNGAASSCDFAMPKSRVKTGPIAFRLAIQSSLHPHEVGGGVGRKLSC